MSLVIRVENIVRSDLIAIDQAAPKHAGRKQEAGRPKTLTRREREIVSLVAMGHPNKIIAHQLNISIWTVSTHLRHIFAKLNVSSRAAVVAKVLRSEGMDADYRQSCSA
jgi:DNA-binding NarL/FixJ family response regulator